MNKDELIEELSNLEHEQWIEWAKTILKQENISEERKARWEEFFVPYSELSDDIKEYDRVWARKIIELLKGIGVIE